MSTRPVAARWCTCAHVRGPREEAGGRGEIENRRILPAGVGEDRQGRADRGYSRASRGDDAAVATPHLLIRREERRKRWERRETTARRVRARVLAQSIGQPVANVARFLESLRAWDLARDRVVGVPNRVPPRRECPSRRSLFTTPRAFR